MRNWPVPEDLIGLLGMEKAFLLCEAWGGKKLPSLAFFLREMRKRKMMSDLRRGYSPTEVSLKYQVKLHTVYEYVAKLRKEREALTRAGVRPETGPTVKEVT